MSVINTNVKALTAQQSLKENNRVMSTAMERLSSGKRINSAKDDAAGLNIATRMETQSRGLSVAIRNANDGISLMQTAEGAMEEMTTMLQRMRELSLQSANAVNNGDDRSALDAEVQQLSKEIDRIASTTRFNDQLILNGSFQGKELQIGAKAGETLDVSMSNMSASSLGRSALTNASLAVTQGSAKGKDAIETVAQLAFHGNDAYTFKVAGVSVSASVTGGSAAGVVDAINANLKQAGNTSISATLNGGSVELRNSLGGNIAITDFTSANSGKATFTVSSGGGDSVLLDDTAAVTQSGTAQGVANSNKGVVLALAQSKSGKEQTFDLNGTKVTIDDSETDASIKAKLQAALNDVTNFEVLINGDTPSTLVTSFSAACNLALMLASVSLSSMVTLVPFKSKVCSLPDLDWAKASTTPLFELATPWAVPDWVTAAVSSSKTESPPPLDTVKVALPLLAEVKSVMAMLPPRLLRSSTLPPFNVALMLVLPACLRLALMASTTPAALPPVTEADTDTPATLKV